ncbi:hypothetical protein K6V98_01970 [Collinsella sp. AGMB00827]|uniref:DUF7601 domain-containing protein n=1 Tax=Collinsella ureilytica TaxID=2869515 RepID=A0ABS7MID2_9ACTN|nr:FctA domain-containing protein [Collinsella urealyticum]MBY4797131.1 hypothetical protein [Collinsella urealyticum]
MKIMEQVKHKIVVLATACAFVGTAVFGAATPVLADPVPTTNGDVTITKTLKGATTSLPASQTFTFHFAKKELTETGAAALSETPEIADKVITIGSDQGNYLMKEVEGATTTLTQNLKFNVTDGLTFPHAGVYAWTVTETGSVAGITMSKAEYTLRIYHDNNGHNTVTVEKKKNDAGEENGTGKVAPNPTDPTNPNDPDNPDNPDTHKSGFIFNNVMIPGEITGNNNLKITKTVNGDFGDRTRPFQFHLTLTKPTTATAAAATAYVYNADNNKASNDVLTFTYGTSQAFTLKHGQYLKFEDGMVDGTTYVLTEDGVPSYTAAATTVMGGGSGVAANKAADGRSAISAGNGVYAAAGATNAGANTADVTNTFAEVTPTGIAISVLPFAVMVLIPVAAAAAWVISRRRSGEGA